MTITETCSCGATFQADGSPFPTDKTSVEAVARRWRTEHRHEPPTPQPQSPQEQRDTQLDALVETAMPTRIGFQPDQHHRYPQDDQ